MNKLSVKEILNHPELAQYIVPQNCALFLTKSKDYVQVANMANTSITEAAQRILELSTGHTIEEALEKENSDVIVTREYAKSINGVFQDYHNKISADKLMLYVGLTASRVLQSLNRAFSERPLKGKEELFFENGDYVVVDETKINGNISNNKETQLFELKDRLARVILIAASQFADNQKRNKKYVSEIAGTYYHSGQDGRKEKIKFTEKELLDYARSVEVMASMSNEALAKAIDEGLASKNTLLKHIEKGKIDKKVATDFLEYGVITADDFVKRVHKKSNFGEVMEDPSVDHFTKLILFNNNRVPLETFKKVADFSLAFKAYIFKNITIQEFQDIIKTKNLEPEELSFTGDWNIVATAYSDRDKKDIVTDMSELLTHDVFDYTQSMSYLEFMQRRKIISEEDKKYLENIMRDFKINELVNDSENQLIEVKGEGNWKESSHVSSLTIDPQARINYLTSLGAVKKLIVRGENFVKDSPEEIGKRNSLDGYEMFIIPSKKIAVLEKLYETTRDKQGNIIYRHNKKGELIPAVENATYIMPIEMAKEFVEKKNKRDLIKSPYVERSIHTADWVMSTERKIKKIRPEVEFNRDNSQKWSELIKQNYKKNKDERSLL